MLPERNPDEGRQEGAVGEEHDFDSNVSNLLPLRSNDCNYLTISSISVYFTVITLFRISSVYVITCKKRQM